MEGTLDEVKRDRVALKMDAQKAMIEFIGRREKEGLEGM
jgi:hypothetical protein